MYTSGTTGDPKGVMISNESIITLLAGVNRLLESVNEEVISFLISSYLSMSSMEYADKKIIGNLGTVWFQFLKTVFCSKQPGEQGKQGEHVWFSVIFCSKKHREHRKR